MAAKGKKKAFFVIEIEATEATLSQMRRGGFSVSSEGGDLHVHVPNRVVPADASTVRFRDTGCTCV